MKLLQAQRNQGAPDGGGDPFAGMGETIEASTAAPAAPAASTGEEQQQQQQQAAPAASKEAPPAGGEGAAAGEEGGGISPEGFTVNDLSEEFKSEPVVIDNQSRSWMDIAKDIELEIPTDTFDAFKEGFNGKLSKAKEEAVSEFLEKEKGFSAEAIRYITALNNGATEFEIYKVEEPYRDFLSMSAEEKIIERARYNGFSEEKGREELDNLIAEGKLDEEVSMIDKAIKQQMDLERSKYLERYQQIAADNKAKEQAQAARENELISKAITERADFMGVPLTKEVKDQLVSRWNAGVYRKAFQSNPNAVVEFILAMELGKKVMHGKIDQAQIQQKKELQGKLHNLQSAQEAQRHASQQVAQSRQSSPDDPWADYEGLDDVQTQVRFGSR